MSDVVAIGLAVALLAANAFFVGAEFALISARRATIEPRAAGGSRAARTTIAAMENVTLMMSGAQLGITICSFGLGAVGEPAVAHLIERPFQALGMPDALLHPIAFAIALSVVVFLHVVLGEMVPKNIARAGPGRTAPRCCSPRRWSSSCGCSARSSPPSTRSPTSPCALRVTPKDEVTSVFTRDEVADLFTESRREGLLDDEEHQLLSGAINFDERDVRAVLLPAERLVTAPAGVTPAEVEGLAARTGFSRFPARDSSGDLVGYLHLKDVLEVDPAARDRPIPAERLRPLPTVRAGDKLHTALGLLQARGAHLAQVRDRAGRLVGVATLEDILEELVGEVRDETRRAAQPNG